MLGAIKTEFKELLIWAFVEYLRAMDTKYLPALWGI